MKALGFFCLSLGLALSGCNQGQCQYNGDCDPGLVCIARQCISPPQEDRCPGGESPCEEASECASLECTNGCCTPPCTGPADCDVEETCVDGVCKAVNVTTGCKKSADCMAPTPFCIASTSTCVECRSSADCGAYKTCSQETHTCGYAPGVCAADEDCAASPSIPRCDVTQHLCVGCLSLDDCSIGETCSQMQTCVPAPPAHCTQESECVGNILGLVHCDVDQSLCVRCVTNSHCPSSQICRARTCVPPSGCQSDSGCSAQGARVCDVETGACVQCLDTNQCTVGQACVNRTCGDCLSDSDCDTSAAGPACSLDVTPARCVQCNAAEDCSRPGASCMNHRCVGGVCSQDADCANSPSGSYCVEGACVGCRTSDQCTFGLSCVANQCVVPSCDTDADCTSAVTGPHCDVSDHRCYLCAADSQCPPTLTCQNHGCALLACMSDPDCATNALAQHCEPERRICVECGADTDCEDGEQCIAGTCGDHATCTNSSECGTSGLCVPIPVNDYTAWTDRCVPRINGAVGGAPCATYSDCASGVCYHVAGNTTDGICLSSCDPGATSTGCATGMTCPAHGVTLTLPGPDGVLSSTAPSDDVSGVVHTCFSSACTTDAQCAGKGFRVSGPSVNRVCGITPNPEDPAGAPLYNCVPLTGYVAGGMPCFDNSDCRSNICLEWTDSTMRTTGRCFGACTRDADCPSIDHATPACRDVSVQLGSETLALKSCIVRP